MAQYRFLQDCYVNGFYFNAGDVASLPGWQPSGAVDPIDNAAITAFFNAGPQRLVGPIRPRWSGQVVSPPRSIGCQSTYSTAAINSPAQELHLAWRVQGDRWEDCRDRTEALMRYRLSSAWPMGAVLCPAGTVIDANANDRWSQLAKGKTIPINATPLDEEAWQAQLAAYPDHRYLLGGGWQ